MLTLELIGNLGSDALVKDFSGQKYISFSVAHSESYMDAQSVKHDKTTWVNCLKYGEGNVFSYLKKGTRVFVRGDLSTKIYDSHGTLQVALNCRVKELQLIGGGNKTEQGEQNHAKTETESSAPVDDIKQNDDLPF
jgi:single-strand DNA-binding protein